MKAKWQCIVHKVGLILYLLEKLLGINLPWQEGSIFVPDRVDKCGKHKFYILNQYGIFFRTNSDQASIPNMND